MLGRIKEIPANIFCTSIPQEWHKPRGDSIEPEPGMKCSSSKASSVKDGKHKLHPVNFNEENKTFKFERHVSATPVPSSVYRWNYNDEQYIAENLNNNSMIQQLITKKD